MGDAGWSRCGPELVPPKLLAVLVLLLVSGCVSRHVLIPYRGVPDHAPGSFAELPAALADTGDDLRPEESVPGGAEAPFYRAVDVRIPSPRDDGQRGSAIVGRLFESRLPGRHPLVIVLPLYGSAYRFPSNNLTSMLLHRDAGQTSVLQIQSSGSLLAWDLMKAARDVTAFHAALLTTRERIEASVVDVRRMIDWAVRRPGTDPSRLGLVGFSEGGLVASLVLVSDPRVGAAALVMTGAHPADVFTQCGWDAGDARREATKRFGWSLTRYRQEMEDVFGCLDVAHLRSLVRPERVLIAEAAADVCFPAVSRDALWEAMGRPRRIVFDYGHKYSFVSMTPLGGNYLTSEIVRLFDQELR